MAIFKPFAFQGEAAAASSYVTANLLQYIDPFDSTIVGSDISDLSGNGNTATGYNSIAVVGSKGAGGNSGWELNVASTSSPKYIVLSLSSYTSNITVGWTHELFFRRAGTSQTSEPYIASLTIFGGAPYSTQRLLNMGVKNAPISYQYYTQIRDGSATFAEQTSGINSTADTDWHHLVMTYEVGVGQKFYFDGTLNHSKGVATGTINYSTATDVVIGGPITTSLKRGFGNSYVGLVRQYNRALTADEVLQNFNYNKADYAIS